MERYRAHLRTKEPEPSGAEVPQVADPLRRVESGSEVQPAKAGLRCKEAEPSFACPASLDLLSRRSAWNRKLPLACSRFPGESCCGAPCASCCEELGFRVRPSGAPGEQGCGPVVYGGARRPRGFESGAARGLRT